MVFYNIKAILKYLYKCLGAFFYILLIVLALFLIIFCSNSVSAETITYEGVTGSAFSQADFNDIEASFNNLKGNYTNYICLLVPGNNAFLYLFNYDSNNKVHARLTTDGFSDNRISSDSNYNYSIYELIGGGRGNLITSGANSNLNSAYYSRFSFSNSLPYICSNIPIFNYSNSDIFWAPDGYNTFVPPSLNPNPTDAPTALTSGQFTFFIVNPR